MISTIENIKLDNENVEFNNAAEFVRLTDKLVYLTGKAGTGKTTFLKYIKKITDKNTVILAPTGVAAINAGGVTIHSFFQIPLGPFVPGDSRLRTNATGSDNEETIFSTFRYREDKLEIIKNLDLLIIDEISMVRADTLDVIDRLLRVFRKKPHLPFGGVQVILIGDIFQLAPIADDEQWSILSQFYKTQFFFSSKVIEDNVPVYIELKKIYRQKEQEFIDLLNRVRVNKVTDKDFQILNSKYNPTFSGDGSDYIILATHNKIVNETNQTKLNQLVTKLFTYVANVTGDFPDKNKPTDHFLNLKEGAQIMFIKNDSGEFKRYHNGKIGKIKELEENSIKVVFDDESEVIVERAIWNNIQYSYNKDKKKIEEKIIGTFEQFPIRLAWAITVHKSQGLTFDKVIADLGQAFASGQVYVALSRCTSLNGLVLKSIIDYRAVITDRAVINFAENETPSTLIVQELNSGKADFYYKKVRESINKRVYSEAYDYFIKAIRFRNDIESDIFKRYFVVTASKLSFSKKKQAVILEQNEVLIKENQKLKSSKTKLKIKKDNLVIKNEALDNELQILSTSVDRLKHEINILSEDLDFHRNNSRTTETAYEKLKRSNQESLKIIESKNILLQKSKNEISKLISENTKLNDQIENQTTTIDNLKIEIERLNKINWFQKLIGIKK